jgi:transcription antitermination factor NusG
MTFALADGVPDSTWVAVWTKPRAEKAAARALESHAVTHWLPIQTVRRQWSDRWKDVEIPLFPGYLFAEASVRTWLSLLRVPGVLTVVKRGRDPAWISANRMAEVRCAVQRAKHVAHSPHGAHVVEDFEVGDRVRVVDGPIAGLVGVVRETRGSRRLLVGFEEIGLALSVSIGTANVEASSD